MKRVLRICCSSGVRRLVPKQPFGGAYCGREIFMKYVSGSVFEQPIISTRDEMDKTLGPETFALTP